MMNRLNLSNHNYSAVSITPGVLAKVDNYSPVQDLQIFIFGTTDNSPDYELFKTTIVRSSDYIVRVDFVCEIASIKVCFIQLGQPDNFPYNTTWLMFYDVFITGISNQRE